MITKKAQTDGMSTTLIIVLILVGAIITLYIIGTQTNVFKSILGMN